MGAFRIVNRTDTGESLDINTTLHASCKNCNHWHNASDLHLHMSRHGSFSNNIVCKKCGHSSSALGGLLPRLTFMSGLTDVQEHQDQVSSASSHRQHGYHSPPASPLAALSRIASALLSQGLGHSLQGSHYLDTRSSAPEPELDGRTACTSTEYEPVVRDSHSSSQRPRSDTATTRVVLPEDDERTAHQRTMASWTRGRFQKLMLRVKTTSHKVFLRVKTREIGLNWRWRPRPSGDSADVSTVDTATSAHTVPTAIVSTAAAPATRSADPGLTMLPRANQLCAECLLEYHQIRQQKTDAKREQVMRACPRSCCQLIHRHGLRDDDFSNDQDQDQELEESSRSQEFAAITLQPGGWVNENRRLQHSNNNTLTFGPGSHTQSSNHSCHKWHALGSI